MLNNLTIWVLGLRTSNPSTNEIYKNEDGQSSQERTRKEKWVYEDDQSAQKRGIEDHQVSSVWKEMFILRSKQIAYDFLNNPDLYTILKASVFNSTKVNNKAGGSKT